MEYQVIDVIDEIKNEETLVTQQRRRKAVPNGASVMQSRLHRDEHEVLEPEKTESRGPEESDRNETSFEHSLSLIERRLEERRRIVRQGEGRSSSICIFKFPLSLMGIDRNAQQPELVSIGPYHRGKDHLLEFEEQKWSFLEKFLSRTRTFGRDLSNYLEVLRALEQQTRECYSDVVLMSSHDFVEMMLLDGCFIVELLLHLGRSGDVIDADDPIFTRPWLIPILIRDLLKLENQLPYFVLDKLFSLSRTPESEKIDPLPILALKVFDLAFPRPFEIIYGCGNLEAKHLLDLFHWSLLPSNQVYNYRDSEEYFPSDQSIQCVTQLRPSGIKFKPRKSDSFLEIKFRNQVLEIPSITINDFTSTILINCVALEQCQESISKYFTDYVSFMNCLINQPRDVSFLCSDGIITRFSQDDQYVANLFNSLGKNIVFNVRHSYLSKQFREVESYYSSNWATMMRTYFSSPWSVISVSSAIILLVLTMVQSIMSVVSYKCQSR